MSDTLKRIVLTKFRDAGFFGFATVIATYVGLVAAIESIYSKYILGNAGYEALTWALVFVSSIYILGGLAVFCGISQLKLSDELHRVIAARNKLENKVLSHKRQTSTSTSRSRRRKRKK